MSNHKTLLKDVEDFELDVKRCLKDIAKESFTAVVDFSPKIDIAEFAVGPYIMSHNISTNGVVDGSFHPFEDIDDYSAKIRYPQSVAIALSKIRKNITLKNIVIGEKILVSNSIPYVEFVEFIGWKRTLPYHTYKKAHTHGETYADSRVKQV